MDRQNLTDSKGRPLSETEGIKLRSRFLRGTLEVSLEDGTTGAVTHDDTKLTKFHGIYQQDDRDVRAERAAQKLEPAYMFMIRVRIPGGVLTPEQWLAVDAASEAYGNGKMRLTTRQSIQLHGVLKRNLRSAVKAINDSLLTTIAACGDVNRTVACTPLPELSALHAETQRFAVEVAEHLRPRTGAYREIWLGERSDTPPPEQEEPIYGSAYLPRKFKIGFAVPPMNDIDVYSQDLAFIAVQRGKELAGFNVAVGGGLGMTHGDPKTYPRLATEIGFCTPDQVLAVAEHVVGIQRDYGDRSDRSHARFKYTVDDHGVDWVRQELERRIGASLAPAVPVRFHGTGDSLGWVRGEDGLHHLTLYVPAGRIKDAGERRFRTGLNEIAKIHSGDFRITGNSNLIVARVAAEDVAAIDRIVEEHGLDLYQTLSPLRRNAMTCVALPTCGLAMAEAERYLPDLLAKVEPLLDKHGLLEEQILLRMTGCPNGCARPYLAEIALVGKAPGRYNLFLGGGTTGQRLNELYAQNLPEPEILKTLDELFASFAARRLEGEAFGDYVRRAGIVGGEAEAASAGG
ncbi:MAG: NADPH-dependent assimilatory sulfite reductase hemoprotein subunit [Gammaproteobacteria bacterium]|nr:NADPH-dependent assimilatory sulfite reductase hemoprotein subunit [Gammaproteobacteria bacterium]